MPRTRSYNYPKCNRCSALFNTRKELRDHKCIYDTNPSPETSSVDIRRCLRCEGRKFENATQFYSHHRLHVLRPNVVLRKLRSNHTIPCEIEFPCESSPLCYSSTVHDDGLKITLRLDAKTVWKGLREESDGEGSVENCSKDVTKQADEAENEETNQIELPPDVQNLTLPTEENQLPRAEGARAKEKRQQKRKKSRKVNRRSSRIQKKGIPSKNASIASAKTDKFGEDTNSKEASRISAVPKAMTLTNLTESKVARSGNRARKEKNTTIPEVRNLRSRKAAKTVESLHDYEQMPAQTCEESVCTEATCSDPILEKELEVNGKETSYSSDTAGQNEETAAEVPTCRAEEGLNQSSTTTMKDNTEMNKPWMEYNFLGSSSGTGEPKNRNSVKSGSDWNSEEIITLKHYSEESCDNQTLTSELLRTSDTMLFENGMYSTPPVQVDPTMPKSLTSEECTEFPLPSQSPSEDLLIAGNTEYREKSPVEDCVPSPLQSFFGSHFVCEGNCNQENGCSFEHKESTEGNSPQTQDFTDTVNASQNNLGQVVFKNDPNNLLTSPNASPYRSEVPQTSITSPDLATLNQDSSSTKQCNFHKKGFFTKRSSAYMVEIHSRDIQSKTYDQHQYNKMNVYSPSEKKQCKDVGSPHSEREETVDQDIQPGLFIPVIEFKPDTRKQLKAIGVNQLIPVKRLPDDVYNLYK